MEQIGSNPYLNTYANHYRRNAPQAQPGENAPGTQRPIAAENLRNAPQPTSKSDSYANMFEDDTLMKLQRNLQSVSELAERALKRIEA